MGRETGGNLATNFNDTVPAAPAGCMNVKWQTDGSGNDSAYVAVAQEIIAANVSLTGQTANINTTTLLTPSASRLYRVSAYIIVTTVSSPGSTLPALTIGWTDADNSTAQTIALTATSTGNTLTTYKQGVCILNALTAVAITYATGSYASGGTPMQYSLYIRLEAI